MSRADSYYPTLPTWALTALSAQRERALTGQADNLPDKELVQKVTVPVIRVCDIHNGGPSIDGPVDIVGAVGILGNGEARCLVCLMSAYYYSAPHADGVTFAGFTAECAARMDGAK